MEVGGTWVGGGRLFEAGRLLTFPAFRMGAYSRWELIRSWALIRINTVLAKILLPKKIPKSKILNPKNSFDPGHLKSGVHPPELKLQNVLKSISYCEREE